MFKFDNRSLFNYNICIKSRIKNLKYRIFQLILQHILL